MSDHTPNLEDLIGTQLRHSNYDLLDLVPIPSHGDRMVRLRTLQEALDEFERAGPDGAVGYLLQIKPSRAPQTHGSARPVPSEMPVPLPDEALGASPGISEEDLSPEARELARKPATDPVYLPDGKLNIPYLMKNADLLRGVGDYPLAKNVYRAVLASGEHAAPALFGLARCLHAEGKLEQARARYEESLAYQPSLEAYRQLAALLMGENRHAQAAETLERALAMKEVSPATRFELCKAGGNCWARAQRPADAERLYQRALEIDPSADEIRANLGALYLALGRAADARRHFNDALAANPKNAKALAGLGSCSLAEGDKRGAHDHFARSLEVELNNPDAVFYVVKLGYELKTYATAARLLEEYVQIAPVNTNLLYSLAGLQFHLGRLNDAKTTLERVLGLQPGHAGAADLMQMIVKYSK